MKLSKPTGPTPAAEVQHAKQATASADFRSGLPEEMLQLERRVGHKTPYNVEFQGAMFAWAQGRFDDAKHGFATVANLVNSTPGSQFFNDVGPGVMELAKLASEKAKVDGNRTQRPQFQADPGVIAELDRLIERGAVSGDQKLQSGALFQKFVWTGDASLKEQAEAVFLRAVAARETQVAAAAASATDRGQVAQPALGGDANAFTATAGGTGPKAGVLNFRLQKTSDGEKA